MAFTYNPSADPVSEAEDYLIALIRLQIGDSIEGDGPKRGGENFADAEILLSYAAEGSHRQRTVARLYETLSAEWAHKTGSETLESIQESSQQAYAYTRMATVQRKQWGYGADAALTSTSPEAFHAKLRKNYVT
jgi:hypothetical protein